MYPTTIRVKNKNSLKFSEMTEAFLNDKYVLNHCIDDWCKIRIGELFTDFIFEELTENEEQKLDAINCQLHIENWA